MEEELSPRLDNNLAEIFTSKQEVEQLYTAIHNCLRTVYDSTYTIFPLSELKVLIAELSTQEHHRDRKTGKHKFKVRYLVDVNFHLWFAYEGSANRYIPAHYQMTGKAPTSAQCIVSGNIEFSEDYQFITRINHKSGDFQPGFDALKWLLAILIVNKENLPVEFAPALIIEELSSRGMIIKKYTITPVELSEWIHVTFNHENIELFASQPKELKQLKYPLVEPDMEPDIEHLTRSVSQIGMFRKEPSLIDLSPLEQGTEKLIPR